MNITTEAAEAIQVLLSEEEGGGLRLFLTEADGEGSHPNLKLAVAQAPHPGDAVVAEHGTQVFVEQRLTAALESKTLDISRSDGDDRIGFKLVS